jgi:dTDP-4-amino-4,6-dideoxygalactose transaminase
LTDANRKRVFLSAPDVRGAERELVNEAFDSNWIGPLGPHVDAFEREVAAEVGVAHSAALSSGTAALHLAMRLIGVEPGDEVLCSSFTFAASANPIVYAGGVPVFVDCDASWTLDPNLVEDELRRQARTGRRPRALISVDLYGQPANYDVLEPLCEKYGVPIVEDAAEALGARSGERAAGSFGRVAVLSFNGNKIITSGGGGMLLSSDRTIVETARSLATQAREPAPHYEHRTIGYNYRMSNVLAAIGRGQLASLHERVRLRRRNFSLYVEALGDCPGLTFMPEADWGIANRWLTCLEICPDRFGCTREDVRLALEKENIEARPVWKPMHLQPVFQDARKVGGDVSANIFERGLCLPSGSNLSDEDRNRVIGVVRGAGRG